MPKALLGGNELWIQARLVSYSGTIASQFLRSWEGRVGNCFELKVNHKTVLITTPTHGSITGSGSYTPGTSATITAVPNPGYRFTGWTGAASGTENPLTITMDADKTVGAAFEPDLSDADADGLTAYDEVTL